MAREKEYIINVKAYLLRNLSMSWLELLDEVQDSWVSLFESQRFNRTIASAIVASLLSTWPDDVKQRFGGALDQYFIDVLINTIDNTELGLLDDITKSPQYLRVIDVTSDSFFKFLRKLIKMEISYIDKYVIGHSDMIDYHELNKSLIKTVPKFTDYLDGILNSETSKLIISGKILAWTKDSDNKYYNYWWDSVGDDNTKDISLLLERGSPYTLSELSEVFMVEHSKPHKIVNRKTNKTEWQVSSYNCRCSVRRTPKSKGQLVSEGLVSAMRDKWVA